MSSRLGIGAADSGSPSKGGGGGGGGHGGDGGEEEDVWAEDAHRGPASYVACVNNLMGCAEYCRKTAAMLGPEVTRLLADCWPTVGRLLADCWRTAPARRP
jgi:hypothetical protein